MKKLLLFFLCIAFAGNGLKAQSPGRPPGFSGSPSGQSGATPRQAAPAPPQGTGKITGSVVDSVGRKAVEFATVALISSRTNKPIDGTVCDAKGQFTLNQIAAGTYRLSVTFVGYRTYTSSLLTIDEKGS